MATICAPTTLVDRLRAAATAVIARPRTIGTHVEDLAPNHPRVVTEYGLDVLATLAGDGVSVDATIGVVGSLPMAGDDVTYLLLVCDPAGPGAQSLSHGSAFPVEADSALVDDTLAEELAAAGVSVSDGRVSVDAFAELLSTSLADRARRAGELDELIPVELRRDEVTEIAPPGDLEPEPNPFAGP
jgi:hypothetical protein